MAAASQLNAIPSGKKPSFGVANPASAWPSRPLAMHVARPKSAKGRTRPLLTCSHSAAAYASSPAPSSPPPLNEETSRSGQRVSSSQVFPTEVPDLLQQVPLRTSSSLNKYRVLPSIGRNSAAEGTPGQALGARMEKKDERSFGDRTGQAAAPRGHKGGGGECTAEEAELEEPGEGEPRLLLAIRSPSGRRFERHFRPSDSLKTVLAVAARENSALYGRCSLGTAEVPRRTFSDLSRSLEECGVPHKSVLCILREERGQEP